MQKIDLKKIEYIGIWLWRMLLAALLLIIINNQDIAINEARTNYSVLEPLITNTAKIVSETNLQPEIPDANNEEYQASCPARPNILDDPGLVLAFFEMVDELNIPNDPFKQQILISLLIGDREGAYNYMESQVTSGYPSYK